MAGSYYVESLTDELERQAYAYFDRIQAEGGMLKAIDKGFFKKEIGRSSRRQQAELEAKERIIVGLNEFIEEGEEAPHTLKIDPKVEKKQVTALRAMKAKRDAARLKKALSGVEKAARGKANLVPPVLEAVRAYGTLQEICDVMRGVFGTYRESTAF